MRISLPEAVGKGYSEFWHCKKRYRVVKGGKASKKSSTAALWFIYNLMKYPAANLLVVRQVANTHPDSTFAQLKWAIHRLGVDNYWEAVRSPLEIRYKPTGQKILFRGFDDPLKLASATVERGYLCWVWVEEAFELASEADFDKLDLSAPRGRVPPPLFKQTTLTFNPWSEKHWLKKRFFDTPREDTLAITTNYLCNEFLDAVDLERYRRMREENPRQYAVAGLGEWGIAEGLVYDNWEVADFKVQEMLRGEESWKYKAVFGLDYGYTNDPTAFIALLVNKADKIIYVFDEIYQRGMVNSEIAAAIAAKGYAKERIRADSAEPKSNEELRRYGIARVFPAEKGRDSILNGISLVREYKIRVLPACRHTIAELSGYHWEQDKAGDGKNRPCDTDNHLMDALRYAMGDIRNFRPREISEPQRKGSGGIRPEDLKGGWNG